MSIEMLSAKRIETPMHKVSLQNDDYPAQPIWSKLVNTFLAVNCLPISHGSAVNKPSGVKMIAFEQMQCYPGDPGPQILMDLDDEFDVYVEPQVGVAPLEMRVAELQDLHSAHRRTHLSVISGARARFSDREVLRPR